MDKKYIPLQSNEEIKSIIGYEGLYSITSFGRVWSHERKVKSKNNSKRIVKAKFLKSGLDKGGYLVVSLCKEGKLKTFKPHRLVAIHYIENPYDVSVVNHKDGVKVNCRKDNLEWCTQEDNECHAIKNNLRKKETSKYYGVYFSKNLGQRNKPWIAHTTVNKKRIYIGYFKTEIEAAKAYNAFVIKYNLNRPLNKF